MYLPEIILPLCGAFSPSTSRLMLTGKNKLSPLLPHSDENVWGLQGHRKNSYRRNADGAVSHLKFNERR
jgi:hypothetical protein